MAATSIPPRGHPARRHVSRQQHLGDGCGPAPRAPAAAGRRPPPAPRRRWAASRVPRRRPASATPGTPPPPHPVHRVRIAPAPLPAGAIAGTVAGAGVVHAQRRQAERGALHRESRSPRWASSASCPSGPTRMTPRSVGSPEAGWNQPWQPATVTGTARGGAWPLTATTPRGRDRASGWGPCRGGAAAPARCVPARSRRSRYGRVRHPPPGCRRPPRNG